MLKPPSDHIVRFNLSHETHLLATKQKMEQHLLCYIHFSNTLYNSLFDKIAVGIKTIFSLSPFISAQLCALQHQGTNAFHLDTKPNRGTTFIPKYHTRVEHGGQCIMQNCYTPGSKPALQGKENSASEDLLNPVSREESPCFTNTFAFQNYINQMHLPNSSMSVFPHCH